jgi:PAS domain S-box-containing protein
MVPLKLDVQTLAFMTSLVFACQTIAIFVQYRVNKTYRGLGWWLAGAILQAIGFFLILSLNSKSLWMLSVLANPLIFLGQVILNVGIAKFLGEADRRWPSAALFAVFLLAYFYFILLDNSIFGRSLTVSASAALITILMALALFRGRKASFSGSALFTACVFLAYGCLQTLLTVMTFVSPHLSSYDDFYDLPSRQLSFILPILGSILWSFGFIIMVNQRLNAENAEEKKKLLLIFNMVPDGQMITRMGDGLLIDASAGLFAMTGHARTEIVGRPIRESRLWADAADFEGYVAELTDRGLVENRESVLRRKDGTRFVGMISGRVISIHDEAHIISVVRDITERKQADQDIRDLLGEKELILKEVHHRIKNNMGTIYSLLSLQAASLKDPTSIAALEDAKSRIQSMMMIYETLYKSVSFIEASVGDYFPPLIDAILSNFPEADSIRVEKDIGDFVLDVKRLQPIGIIMNELLTNIMKYAFVGRTGGMISVSAALVDGKVSIVIQDDGGGIPESVDFENSTGFGLMLVGALTKQLGGTIGIERGGGTRIRLEFAK